MSSCFAMNLSHGLLFNFSVCISFCCSVSDNTKLKFTPGSPFHLCSLLPGQFYIFLYPQKDLSHFCKMMIWKSGVKRHPQKNTSIYPCISTILQTDDIQISNIKIMMQKKRPVKLVKLEKLKIVRGDI